MSKSLGFRRGVDHIANRPGEMRVHAATPLPAPAAVSQSRGGLACPKMTVFRGFVPLLLYSSIFASLPLIYEYVDIDYANDGVRTGVITLSSTVATIVVMANDCAAWFNMALFFHVGVEVRVLDVLMEVARRPSTSDADEALAWSAFAVILVHLIPFFLLDHAAFLTVLAFAGVVVNAAALVVVQPELLLLTGLSSTVLLGATLCICARQRVCCSLFHNLRSAMQGGGWFACLPYEM